MTDLTAEDLTALLDSLILRLHAERKSGQTVTSYRLGVQQYPTSSSPN